MSGQESQLPDLSALASEQIVDVLATIQSLGHANEDAQAIFRAAYRELKRRGYRFFANDEERTIDVVAPAMQA